MMSYISENCSWLYLCGGLLFIVGSIIYAGATNRFDRLTDEDYFSLVFASLIWPAYIALFLLRGLFSLSRKIGAKFHAKKAFSDEGST